MTISPEQEIESESIDSSIEFSELEESEDTDYSDISSTLKAAIFKYN